MRGVINGAVVAFVLISASAQAAPTSKDRFVDCAAAAPGDGSRSAPFTSLAEASAEPLAPGVRVRFRRGTLCEGTLAMTGAGSERRPALISAYGRGKRPRIVASGEDAVTLTNIDHTTIERLDLSNPGDGSEKKRGLHLVESEDTSYGVTVRRMRIHDVGGDLSKDAGGSGAIQIDLVGDGAERFEDMLITRNRIFEVSRSGIFFAGNPGARPRASEPWPEASHGLRITHNRISGFDGDGIVPVGTDGAYVAHNVVSDGNRAGRSPADPQGQVCSAGIWTFHSNNVLIERNEVFDMKYDGDCDGTGFDVDYDQDGTIVQYNYSHDNEGGFILLCTDNEPRTADVRFNLSVDDAAMFHESPCKVASGQVGTLDGLRAYNNTFLTPSSGVITPPYGFELPGLQQTGNFQFKNNIVYGTRDIATPFGCGSDCSHNLFWRIPPSGTDAVVGDPEFARPNDRGIGAADVASAFRTLSGSPAIGAGTPIPDGAAEDFFGRPIPATPTIGFAEAVAQP